MFGHDALPSKIYTYKGRRPIEGLEQVRDQFHKAHVYRNRLVEIERRRREQVEQAVLAHYPDLVEVEARLAELELLLDALDVAIKKQNTAKRKRAGADPTQKAQRATYRVERAALRARRKALRDVAFAEGSGLRTDLARIDEDDKAARKEARADSGLYWGTYLRIEQSMQDCRKGAPPEFRRWTGAGTVAVQVQGGLEWPAATLADGSLFRVQILPPGPGANPQSARSRTKPRAIVWLRVGSFAKGSPIWAKIPIRLFRQPPADARVKWAWLRMDTIGSRETWTVQVVLSRPDDWEKPGDQAEAGTVGVDVGWRLISGDLRVAYALGGDDRKEVLTIPAARLSAWGKADSLRSTRDCNFDAMRARLVAWLAAPGVDLPEWLVKDTETLAQWKAISRLARLVHAWKKARFAGDESVYEELLAWLKQDRHLWDWEASQRVKAARRRDDTYRKFAARLARRYRTVRVEDIDWRELKKRARVDAKVDTPNELDERRRRYASIAAVGRLVTFLREAATEVQDIDAKNTTRACHACGTVEEWDPERDLEHTCGHCGVRWDQDYNAAVWLLRGGVQPLVAAP